MSNYLVEIRNHNSWQQPVLDKDLTTPPGGESKGDRYIVASGGSGDWSGQDNDIAQYNGSSWDFFTPSEGWIVWVEDENVFYKFDGSNWTINKSMKRWKIWFN